MSQYSRHVLAGVMVDRDAAPTFVKDGSVGDIQPGSELEAAYGGPSNLSAVIPAADPSRSPEAAACLSKEALAN
jgi:hypothetical protein